MDYQELSRNCWLILNVVRRWLAEQDELTRALHRVSVEVIQCSGHAPLDLVLYNLYNFEAQYALLQKDCGNRYIENKADAFLSSEFIELSALFCFFYEEFNSRYFKDSLPRYRVKVMHNIPMPEAPDTGFSHQVSVDRREIAIDYNGWPEDMLASLVWLMAYVHTGVERDTAFEEELHRLRSLGAPTPDEVDRLRKSGWKAFSASPWLVS